MDRTSYGGISLDVVIQNILDSMEGDTQLFVARCEKDIMGEIQDYTRKAVCKDDRDITRIAEDHAGDLLDSIYRANHEYF